MITQFNRNIIEAALAAGVHYVDMASDELLESTRGESPQEEFLIEQLDYAHEFEAAGLKAFNLIGGDSGLVNVVAREAVDELDEIDYIGSKDYGIVECSEPVIPLPVRRWLSQLARPPRRADEAVEGRRQPAASQGSCVRAWFLLTRLASVVCSRRPCAMADRVVRRTTPPR